MDTAPQCLSRLVRSTLLLLAGITIASGANLPKELWIASDGNDVNIGTKSHPLASLEAARNRLRQLRKAPDATWPKSGITVWMRAGTYELSQSFSLNEQDSGTSRAPIVYRNVPRETVILSGGRRVTFEPLQDTETRKRLGAVARLSVQVASLRSLGINDDANLVSRGFGRPVRPAHSELFWNGTPMTLARWPNAGEWLTIADIPQDSAQDDQHGRQIGNLTAGFIIDRDRPGRWQSSSNIWVHGYWAWDWANSYERVTHLTANGRHIRTAAPHGLYGFRTGQRFYFLNVLEELDMPGEYYVDTANGQLYFWPPLNSPEGTAVVSMLGEPMILADGVSHVSFQGLTLEAGRSHGIEIRGGHHLQVIGCSLRNLGNHGVLVEGGYDHQILSCNVVDTGDGGVILSGGNRQTLEAARHLCEDCHFQRQGRWSKCYVPAIQLSGVGLLARHNLIQDHPHCGILFSGNDHRIEFNEIHHVALETGDVGAIYTGRDWTYRGNRIVHNYIHDTGGVGMGSMGVYMDDCVSGTEIYGNVFRNVQRAVFLGGGRDHEVENNIFINCRPAIAVDGRGLDPSPVWHDMVYRTMKDRLAGVPRELYNARYPALQDIDSFYQTEQGVPPKENSIQRNISVGGQWLDIRWHAEKAMIDLADNLVDTDPLFVDANAGDFRLKRRSPALEHGFRSIPFDKIGLYQSAARRDLERLNQD